MSASHEIWIVRAGPSGDLHHPDGTMQVSSERLAEELSQIVLGVSDILERVHHIGAAYQLEEATVELTFDGKVGFALVGQAGPARAMTLKFTRTATTQAA
jgi:hypothetical protein